MRISSEFGNSLHECIVLKYNSVYLRTVLKCIIVFNLILLNLFHIKYFDKGSYLSFIAGVMFLDLQR